MGIAEVVVLVAGIGVVVFWSSMLFDMWPDIVYDNSDKDRQAVNNRFHIGLNDTLTIRKIRLDLARNGEFPLHSHAQNESSRRVTDE